MKMVSELFQAHMDEPIWIAGSGPSLDTYPVDFLDGKLATTLHLAYLKYPDTTYRHANEYDRVEWFKENRPAYLSKTNIFAFPFYRRTEREMDGLLDLDRRNYYFFILRPYPPKNVNVIHRMVLETLCGERMDFRDHGSCLHDAIYVAILFGCNPINIIGCEHEPLGDLEHFAWGNQFNYYRAHSTPYASKGVLMKMGTQMLIEACAREGIEVNWIRRYDQE